MRAFDGHACILRARAVLILGLDPGLASVGHAIIHVRPEDGAVTLVEYGTFTTPAKTAEAERLIEIDTWLATYLSVRQPAAVVLERPYPTARMLSNVLIVGMAYGCLVTAVHKARVGVVLEVNSMAVKAAVGLPRGAPKKDMRAAVSRVLDVPLLKGADDGIDAIAVALVKATRDAVDQAQLFRVRA